MDPSITKEIVERMQELPLPQQPLVLEMVRSLAGADAGLFQRHPAEGAVQWTVYRRSGRASFVELPVARRAAR